MLAAHIELILLVTGLATAGAIVVFVAPVPVILLPGFPALPENAGNP